MPQTDPPTITNGPSHTATITAGTTIQLGPGHPGPVLTVTGQRGAIVTTATDRGSSMLGRRAARCPPCSP